jgi:hypothetical protein
VRYRRPYYSHPPRSLRRSRTERDNIALVPASELDSLDRWENAMRQLAPGSVLVVSQPDNVRLQTVARELDKVLRLRGSRAHLLAVTK